MDRIKSYAWGFAATFPGALLVIGSKERWRIRGRFFDPSFSFGAFLSSAAGLFVIAGFALTRWPSFFYAAQVSKKVGSWSWV